MKLVLGFAKEYGYKLCLKTNLRDNIKMYKDFGFKCMETSNYKNKVEHFVIYYYND